MKRQLLLSIIIMLFTSPLFCPPAHDANVQTLVQLLESLAYRTLPEVFGRGNALQPQKDIEEAFSIILNKYVRNEYKEKHVKEHIEMRFHSCLGRLTGFVEKPLAELLEAVSSQCVSPLFQRMLQDGTAVDKLVDLHRFYTFKAFLMLLGKEYKQYPIPPATILRMAGIKPKTSQIPPNIDWDDTYVQMGHSDELKLLGKYLIDTEDKETVEELLATKDFRPSPYIHLVELFKTNPQKRQKYVTEILSTDALKEVFRQLANTFYTSYFSYDSDVLKKQLKEAVIATREALNSKISADEIGALEANLVDATDTEKAAKFYAELGFEEPLKNLITKDPKVVLNILYNLKSPAVAKTMLKVAAELSQTNPAVPNPTQNVVTFIHVIRIPQQISAETHKSIIQEFINANPDLVNMRDTANLNMTPLHHIAWLDKGTNGAQPSQLIDLLISNKADPSLKDFQGNTPLVLATQSGRSENVTALKKNDSSVPVKTPTPQPATTPPSTRAASTPSQTLPPPPAPTSPTNDTSASSSSPHQRSFVAPAVAITGALLSLAYVVKKILDRNHKAKLAAIAEKMQKAYAQYKAKTISKDEYEALKKKLFSNCSPEEGKKIVHEVEAEIT